VNIAILSAFRSCSWDQVDRYFSQAQSLQSYVIHDRIEVYAVEGDSVNNTTEMIRNSAQGHNVTVNISHHHHGYPNWGSIESSERMGALTGVMKTLMASVDPSEVDVCQYVESDLIWDRETIGKLIGHVKDSLLVYNPIKLGLTFFDILSPLIMAGENFYDVWAFRDQDGNRFGPFPPFCKYLAGAWDGNYMETDPLEVNSVGSCLAFRSELARNVIVEGEECLVSWCNSARKQGYKIAVDPTLIVRHP